MQRVKRAEFFTSLLARYADSRGRITNPHRIINRHRAVGITTDIAMALSTAVRTGFPHYGHDVTFITGFSVTRHHPRQKTF